MLQQALAELARVNHPLYLRLREMPFLQTKDPADHTVVTALAYISFYDPQAANDLANNPIQEEDRTRVSLAHNQHMFRRNTNVQDPKFVQNMPLTLPLTNRATLTIASKRQIDTAMSTQVQRALAWMEQYFQAPLTSPHVLIHLAGPTPGSAAGVNTQVSISLPPNPSSHQLQHELAHYWWNTTEEWLHEGMAETIPILYSQRDQPERELPAVSPSCRNTKIEDLAGSAGGHSQASKCVYDLGRNFFLTLHNQAGAKDFQTGLQKLLQVRRTEDHADDYRGTWLTIEHVREAFSHTSEALATAEDAWYNR